MTYCAVLTSVDSNDILYCISIVVSIVHTTNQYYNIIGMVQAWVDHFVTPITLP
jgi:hypothetical protein